MGCPKGASFEVAKVVAATFPATLRRQKSFIQVPLVGADWVGWWSLATEICTTEMLNSLQES